MEDRLKELKTAMKREKEEREYVRSSKTISVYNAVVMNCLLLMAVSVESSVHCLNYVTFVT